MDSSEFGRVGHTLDRFALWVTAWAGSTVAVAVAAGVVLTWAVIASAMGFPDAMLWLINTLAAVTTLLMVFLLQRGQNRNTAAVQLKLNELIAASKGASNRLIAIEAIEDMTDEEIQKLRERFRRLADLLKDDPTPGTTHSVEEVVTEDRARPADDRSE